MVTPRIRAGKILGRFLAVAGTVSSLFALSGCGNNPHPAALQKMRPDGTPWRVRYNGMGDDPRSLDPQVSYDEVSRSVLEAVQDCLLEYHPFKTDPYEVAPCLLEAMPEKTDNPDGSVTYTLRLKHGIHFHNDPCFSDGKGREVTAHDAVYAFQRMADPAVESPALGALGEYIPGLLEAFAAAQKSGTFDYSTVPKGVELVDDFTFRVYLVKPYPQILYWFAMHFTAPVAREGVEYYDGKTHNGVLRELFKFHPVGNGPFIMKEWKRHQRMRLVRNPDYHTTVFPEEGWTPDREAHLRPLAGQKLPIIDEVQLTMFREAIPIFLLTRQGYLDGMGVGKDIFSSVLTASRELSPKYKERGMNLYKTTDPSTFYLSFNMTDPVLGKNKKLRQALSCAFDAGTYLDVFFNGVPPVAEQLLPPGIFGFQKDYKNPYGFNLEKARQLLAEAGYPDGRDAKTGRQLELTLDTAAEGSTSRLAAEYEQRQFEKIGIRLRIVENNFARMLEKEERGDFQIASGTGWGADYPDPENFFFLFYSKNVPPQGKNVSFYSNPEFDQLFEKMAAMENSPERLEIVHRMNAILAEDVPILLEMNRASYGVTQPWAPRVVFNSMLASGLKYAVVDPVLREKKQHEWNREAKWPMMLLGTLIGIGAFYGVSWSRRHNV